MATPVMSCDVCDQIKVTTERAVNHMIGCMLRRGRLVKKGRHYMLMGPALYGQRMGAR